ncbi:MAG TPA: hypothetical protein VNK50_13115 [Calidithermus sp.]|nr:hypothetical protein [Calidithermus sp.]
MAELTVRAFRAADYVAAVREAGLAHDWQDPWLVGRAHERFGVAWTAEIDGALALLAGVDLPWPGRGEPWAVWTPLGQRHAGPLHRQVLRRLGQVIAEHRLRRLQMECVADFAAARRWIAHVGAYLARLGWRAEWEVQGQPAALRRPAWGPQGEDFLLYSWLAPEVAV